MTLLQAVLMGIIQGLTEFLPVSSSGHLALFKILFHVETDTGMLFDVLLHVGTLIAICAVYYKDIVRLFVEGICIVRDVLINFAALIKNLFLSIRDRGKDHVDYSPYRRIVNSSYRKFVVLILVSTIPTGIIGFVGKDVVEQASGLLIVPGICLIATAARAETSFRRTLHTPMRLSLVLLRAWQLCRDYPAAEQRSQHVCSADLTASLQ